MYKYQSIDQTYLCMSLHLRCHIQIYICQYLVPPDLSLYVTSFMMSYTNLCMPVPCTRLIFVCHSINDVISKSIYTSPSLSDLSLYITPFTMSFSNRFTSLRSRLISVCHYNYHGIFKCMYVYMYMPVPRSDWSLYVTPLPCHVQIHVQCILNPCTRPI
jgi:hypothetical protein